MKILVLISTMTIAANCFALAGGGNFSGMDSAVLQEKQRSQKPERAPSEETPKSKELTKLERLRAKFRNQN